MNLRRLSLALALCSLVPQPARAQAQPVGTGDADTNGVSIHYKIYGQGEPLLLLHGFSHTGWADHRPEVMAQARPDLEKLLAALR